MPWNKISASIRLIMAMFRLYAALEENWGRAIKDILRKHFPDAKAEINKASDHSIGQKLMAIAMKQTQYNETKAQDAIQDAIMYWSTGTAEYNRGAIERRDYDKAMKEYEAAKVKAEGEGKPAPPPPDVKKPKDVKLPEPFDFSESGETWEDALNNMYSNLRSRAMSHSMGYTKKEKKERSIDQAYGQRGDEGGAPEGGEGRMPTPEVDGGVGSAGSIGQALDDKTGIKEFVDLIDDALPDLKNFFMKRDPDQLKLFELVFDDDVGSFGSDVNENMNQATALKEKHPDLFQKNQKRWSGFVGDLRKKVLAGIAEFVETHLAPGEYEALYDSFFSDTTPRAVEKLEKEKGSAKLEYQQGIDERKLSKWKWMEQEGKLDDKSKKSYENLKKKLQDQGVDVGSIPPQENPVAKGWTLHSKRAASRLSLEEVSFRVAKAFGRTGT